MKRKPMPPGPARDEIVAKFAAADESGSALAREIGCTPQHARKLMRRHKAKVNSALHTDYVVERGSAPAAEVVPVEFVEVKPKEEVRAVEPKAEAPAPDPSGIPPLPPAPGESARAPGAGADSQPSGNPLEDALRGIPTDGGAAPDAGGGAGALPPDDIRPIPPGEINPKRVAAGRKLAEICTGGLARTVARRVYNVPPDDPRMEELKKPNEILDLALDNNDKNMDRLGRLVVGLPGLLIGAFIEFFRVIDTFGPPPQGGGDGGGGSDGPPPAPRPPAPSNGQSRPRPSLDFNQRDIN